MKTKLLITFEMVARLRSFSAAAKALNTVQPAVSRQITDLENHLKVQLFWRTTRAVKLTPAGEVLLDDVTDILASHKKAEARVQLAAKGQVGTLRIGYLESASYKFLPTIIRQYSALYPDVQIRLDIMTARQQLNAFKSGSIDIGLSRPIPISENLNLACTLIYEDDLRVFVPSEHKFSACQNVRLEELEQENFVQFNRAGARALYDMIVSACLDAGFSPIITHEPKAMQTVLTLVASGFGITIAPSCINYLHLGGCVCIPTQQNLHPVKLEAHHDATHHIPAVENFVKLLRDSRGEIQKMMTFEPV